MPTEPTSSSVEWLVRAGEWRVIWFFDDRMVELINMRRPPDLGKLLTGLERRVVHAMAEHLLRETEETT